MLAGACGLELVRHFNINTDTGNLFPAELGWRMEQSRAACLRAADEVMLALVRESEDGHWDDHVASAEDVQGYLRDHGIKATKLLRPNPGGTVSETLERVARNENADLIVMGAYGHSRLREWVFGGVTRDLLDNTSLCCLMSR